MQSVTILGATGSIGRQTLDVIALNADHYQIESLTANTNIESLFELSLKFLPKRVVVQDQVLATQLHERLASASLKIEVLVGANALCEVARDSAADIVVSAIVGAAGLEPTLAAIKAGKKVLLANKEPLVMSGQIMMQAVRQHQASLLPVDSEHNAIMQCMPDDYMPGQPLSKQINSVVLTASGGPFRNTPIAELETVTPAQAIAHPNWSMGPKISVDSATMMNKGLEVIEAKWLFGLDVSQIEVVMHPQSIIHSMVRYCDGSTMAQMGYHDMRTPIANALAHPKRMGSGVADLDLTRLSQLDFYTVESARYPCLQLIYAALRIGKSAPCVLNAANEVAVAAFLEEQIRYTDIPRVVSQVLDKYDFCPISSVEEVLQVDQLSRTLAIQAVNSLKVTP